MFFTSEMFASYMKLGSLNPFPVTNLRPQVKKVNVPTVLRIIIFTEVTENGVARPT